MPRIAAILTASVVAATLAGAQPRPVSRADVITAAISRGARLEIAAADTGVARGLLLAAREWPNPTLTTSYTEDVPRYHFGFDVPVDYPWVRGTRIRAAEASRTSAGYRFRLERAATALDADTLYTIALATQARRDLSRRNALDADSLRRIAIARRDAGDASTLDVELATLFAGEQANSAVSDSLEFDSVVLSLQTAMGLASDSVRLVLTDSLVPPRTTATTGVGGTPLGVASAQADLDAAELLARLERHNRWAAPALSLGYDTYDPGGTGHKLLPAIGFSLPVPLLNRNGGAIALADAERDRAKASLALARVESQAAIARIRRERDVAMGRMTRSQALVESANRVAAMSLAAYRQGAAPLATVLEAQRTARETLGNYVENMARAWVAIATERVVTLTASPERP